MMAALQEKPARDALHCTGEAGRATGDEASATFDQILTALRCVEKRLLTALTGVEERATRTETRLDRLLTEINKRRRDNARTPYDEYLDPDKEDEEPFTKGELRYSSAEQVMAEWLEFDLLPMLKRRGISAMWTETNFVFERNDDEFLSFDVCASNFDEAVFITTNPTLRPLHVARLLDDLDGVTQWGTKRISGWYPDLRNVRVYGAVAYLQCGGPLREHVERSGLFSIQMDRRRNARIVNTPGFTPRAFV